MSSSFGSVCVIMRSRNSSATIHHVLSALYSQDFQDFELLVVDSGSTDNTLEIVGQFPHRLIRIGQSAYFPGVVLNDAIAQTDAETLVFLNSDCVFLDPGGLRALLTALHDEAVDAVFGRQVARPEAHLWVQRDYAASFPASTPAPPWMKMSLAIAAMKRSAWERHKFYVDAWASEDQEWANWAGQHGLRIDYVPEASVMHSHNYTLRQLHGRRYVEGEADAFIYRDRAGVLRTARRTLADFARDSLYALKRLDALDVARALPRRFVYHYAYYKGHRWGERRLATGNADASQGQSTVLSRYDNDSA